MIQKSLLGAMYASIVNPSLHAVALLITLLMVQITSPVYSATVLYGPSGGSGLSGEYASVSDSPFSSMTFASFYFDDFEDGLLNTLGVSASTGGVLGPTDKTNSVDTDDGVKDGFGADGFSYWSGFPNSAGVTFTFDSLALGKLPTEAGLVLTDSVTNTTVKFFDNLGDLIAVFGPLNVRIGANTETSGDKFIGVSNTNGISSIHISDTGNAFEVDHLQYGISSVPVPAAVWLFGSGLLGLVGVARRKKA